MFSDNSLIGNIKLSGQTVAILVGTVIGFLICITVLFLVGVTIKFKKCTNLRSKTRMSPSLGPLTSGSHQSQGINFYYYD